MPYILYYSTVISLFKSAPVTVRRIINFSVRSRSSQNIMKVLNVAEKNDAAKNIAGVLSRGSSTRREGLSPYNKIYEFNVQLWRQQCKMIMTSVSGHLLNHEFVGAYRKWQGCHPLSLFDAPVIKQCSEESYIKIKKTLERETKGCNALIIWTDCDREGENIGYEIIQVCQQVKPNIRVYRAKFSEITQTSINRALQTLGEPNKAVSDAVDIRSELDLRIGAAFTRFQTLRLQKVFPRTLSDMLISYGSCQFPTLGFVVERFLAIEKFKPEPYWKLKVVDAHGEISVEFRWARVRLFEELPCKVFLDMCLENPNATVQKVERKPKSKWRPLPLDTIELEKQGSRKLQLNAKETMRIAEKLYTQGLISYPRTETNIFPKELNLVPLVNQQVENPAWGAFAQRLLTEGLNPRQGKKSDQAHPPIHPTKYTSGLQGNEAKVYEFVVRHFLACLSKNAEGQETVVEIDIAGEKFLANGLQISAKNYLDVYIYEKWSNKEIHRYQEGQVFRPTSIDMMQEETSPPNLLTEADLIALMDKHGIGTDATHAEHIDTIKSRQYVGLSDGVHFIPGKLGIGLVMGYDSMGYQMSKPNLRADLEADLKMICDNQKDPKDVLENHINKYREVFRVALERASLIDNALAEYLDERPIHAEHPEFTNTAADVIVFKCPKCGCDMTLKDRKQGTGKYISCMGYPRCNNAIWFSQNVEDIEVLNETCTECTGNMRKLKFRLVRNAFPLFGTTYATCIGGCDPSFNEAQNIKSDSVKRISTSMNDTGYVSMDGHSSTTLSDRNFNWRTNRGQEPGGRDSKRTAWKNNTKDKRVNDTNSSVQHTVLMQVMTTSTSGSDNSGWNNSRTSDPTTNDGRINSRAFNRTKSNTRSQTWGNIDNDAVIMCHCHQNAIQLTVRKEGPNQGRLFYKCSKPQGSGCDFFLWASDSTHSNGDSNANDDWRTNSSVTINSNNASNWETNSSTSSNDITCTCNRPARRLTVQKDGPNKGRIFYTCPQSMNGGCKFFKWADGDDTDDYSRNANSGSSSMNMGQTRGRGTGRGGSKKPRITSGKRKCGICGVEGHTRKTCPENVMD